MNISKRSQQAVLALTVLGSFVAACDSVRLDGEDGADEPDERESRGAVAGASARESNLPGEAPLVGEPNDGTCARGVPRGAVEVAGRIGESVTWSGAVHVIDDVSLRNQGTTLTIAPGTQVFVDTDKMIEIGWNSSDHTLDAQGTAEAPIRFCRSQRDARNWKGIHVQSNVTSASALKYVVIEGAGSGADALVLDTRVLVDHVWVRDSLSNGVRAADFREDSQALHVTTSQQRPLVLTNAWAVERLPEGGSYLGNGEDVALLTFKNVGIGARFRDHGLPYQLDEGLSLRTGGVLTVDPGVEWRVGLDELIELGWNGSEAEVQMLGTEQAPILIRGVDERPGSWVGMVVNGQIFGSSVLQHVVIRHGGGNTAHGLRLRARITASDLSFEDNNHEAFMIDEQGLLAGSGRFTVTGTLGSAGRLAAGALVDLPAGGSFRGNRNDAIEVDGGAITRSGTIAKVDVPLQINGTVSLRNGAELSIAAGVEFRMQSGAVWDMGRNGSPGTLKLIGTAQEPIVFRGVLEQPGYWNGVVVQSSITADSVLEYVNVGDAGPGSGANLRLNAPIDVRHCKLFGAAGFGLSVDADYPADYETQNVFEGNAMGSVQLR